MPTIDYDQPRLALSSAALRSLLTGESESDETPAWLNATAELGAPAAAQQPFSATRELLLSWLRDDWGSGDGPTTRQVADISGLYGGDIGQARSDLQQLADLGLVQRTPAAGAGRGRPIRWTPA